MKPHYMKGGGSTQDAACLCMQRLWNLAAEPILDKGGSLMDGVPKGMDHGRSAPPRKMKSG